MIVTGASSEDQSSSNTNSSIEMHRCNNNNDTNNSSDNNNEASSGERPGKREYQETALPMGNILSQALSKDLLSETSNGRHSTDSDMYRSNEASKNHHLNGIHNNQSVIRSIKSERSTISSPAPEPARASPSSGRPQAHNINNSYHHPQQQLPNHTMHHSNHGISPAAIHHISANQSPTHNHHSSSQRGSPLNNPSHQHVTVLVNPSRAKLGTADNPQPTMIQQHHQTTIVGIRRNSPPANSNCIGPGSYSLGQHPNSLAANGASLMQAPQNQLHLLHNPAGLRSSQMSPNDSSSNNNSLISNGSVQQNNGSHSLLAAAAQGQLQIPLQLLQQQHQQQMRIKRERSPVHGLQQHGQVQQSAGNAVPLSPTQHKQLQSPSAAQLNSMNMMNQSMQIRHPMRDASILLRVKNELPNLVQVQQRMSWNANARINGVKPELIGGPLPNMRANSANATSPPQSASQTPPRATPTVIMGESCGVRTMVWGFEPTSAQMPPSPASSSSNQSLAGPSQNEEAAQLLLSLGQGSSRPNDNRPRTTQQRSPHPLNMERLWAGDYSQLPAGQQLHALNLSQPQWMGGGGGQPGNKVTIAYFKFFLLPNFLNLSPTFARLYSLIQLTRICHRTRTTSH